MSQGNVQAGSLGTVGWGTRSAFTVSLFIDTR